MISFVRKPMVHLNLGLTIALLAMSCQRVEPESQQSSASSLHGNYEQVDESTRHAIKMKRARLLGQSLSKVLALPVQQLCLELGRLPCLDLVHRVSLGGMDAYGGAQYEQSNDLAVTAPIAMDRVVLSACSTRGSMDLLNPSQAVIFKDLDLSPDGRIRRDAAFEQSIARLYQRALLRNPRSDEVAALSQLYVDIYENEPIGAARNWAVLACYVVLSSLESIFY